MGFKNLEYGRVFLVRADYESDLLKFLNELAKDQQIEVASFTAIGALKQAKLGFYDQTKHVYMEEALSEPQEIASCTGNISIKDGEPFVHAHAVLADRNGKTKAGHLLEGRVFAAEIHITELRGETITRKKDTLTGLSLWNI
jgi:uncharacterized protein